MERYNKRDIVSAFKKVGLKKGDTIFVNPELYKFGILEKSNNIQEFRIIQKTLNTFKFQIVSDKELCQADKVEILEETSRYLEPGLIIDFELCNKIDDYYSGKIQNFFSELNH